MLTREVAADHLHLPRRPIARRSLSESKRAPKKPKPRTYCRMPPHSPFRSVRDRSTSAERRAAAHEYFPAHRAHSHRAPLSAEAPSRITRVYDALFIFSPSFSDQIASFFLRFYCSFDAPFARSLRGSVGSGQAFGLTRFVMTLRCYDVTTLCC
jgi:hypothetical protein